MRIFIIGPEGAGKTVFLAMLSHYVATQRKDLILEPIDYASAEYVTRAQQALHLGEWPPSTRQGELRLLRWNFGTSVASLSEMQMLDSAGQDLRQILLEDQTFRLTPGQQTIRQMMDQSDFFIYLLDLGSLLATQDMLALTENTWLFKTFLTRPEWQGKKRVVVVSKADIYREALVAQQGDVRKLVKHYLPQHLPLNHLVDETTQVDYLALTSIVTATEIGEGGNPTRKPVVPLRSEGFGDVLPIILSSISAARSKKYRTLNGTAASAFILLWTLNYIFTHYYSVDSENWVCVIAMLSCGFAHWFACKLLVGKEYNDNTIAAIFIGSGVGVIAGYALVPLIVMSTGSTALFKKWIPFFARIALVTFGAILGGIIGSRCGAKIGALIERNSHK